MTAYGQANSLLTLMGWGWGRAGSRGKWEKIPLIAKCTEGCFFFSSSFLECIARRFLRFRVYLVVFVFSLGIRKSTPANSLQEDHSS